MGVGGWGRVRKKRTGKGWDRVGVGGWGDIREADWNREAEPIRDECVHERWSKCPKIRIIHEELVRRNTVAVETDVLKELLAVKSSVTENQRVSYASTSDHSKRYSMPCEDFKGLRVCPIQ